MCFLKYDVLLVYVLKRFCPGICCGSIFKSVSFFETGFIFSNSTVFAFLTITNYMNIFSNLNSRDQYFPKGCNYYFSSYKVDLLF